MVSVSGQLDYLDLPLTFFSLGFFRFAEADALRVALARIAPALFLLTPMRFAIPLWTFLNPGCAMFLQFWNFQNYFSTT